MNNWRVDEGKKMKNVVAFWKLYIEEMKPDTNQGLGRIKGDEKQVPGRKT